MDFWKSISFNNRDYNTCMYFYVIWFWSIAMKSELYEDLEKFVYDGIFAEMLDTVGVKIEITLEGGHKEIFEYKKGVEDEM